MERYVTYCRERVFRISGANIQHTMLNKVATIKRPLGFLDV